VLTSLPTATGSRSIRNTRHVANEALQTASRGKEAPAVGVKSGDVLRDDAEPCCWNTPDARFRRAKKTQRTDEGTRIFACCHTHALHFTRMHTRSN